MPIRFNCQHCGAAIKSQDGNAGHNLPCPKCGGYVSVPPIIPAESIAQSASKNVDVPPDYMKIGWGVGFAICLLTFLFTIRTPPGPGVIVHYLGLMFAVGMVAARLAERLVPKWTVAVAFVVALIAAYLWLRSDYSMRHWTRRTEANDGRLDYTDYTYRLNDDRPFYRDMWFTPDKGESFHLRGGFSESGKRHGQWIRVSAADAYIPQSDWFWYGEQVSEGEWHLRNK